MWNHQLCNTLCLHFASWTMISWVALSCPTLCDSMDCSMLGFPVHHQLPELAQTHVHWVGDATQPSHTLSSPLSPAFKPSQHRGLFQWASSSHQVAKVFKLQLQDQSLQWVFRADNDKCYNSSLEETPPPKALICHCIPESRKPGEPLSSQNLPWGRFVTINGPTQNRAWLH